jgi:hypothetical protein
MNQIVRTAWKRADRTEFFREVIAPWLDDQTAEGWWVRQALEHFPLTELPLEIVEAWIAESPETRAPALAEMLGAPLGRRVSNLHALMLERFGEHGVANAFFGKFISGVFWGSSAARTKGLVAEAQEWTKDERPAVREWALGVVRSLEEMLEREQIREEEERFL